MCSSKDSKRKAAVLRNGRQFGGFLVGLVVLAALALLHPVADDSLTLYRVSEKLNKPGYDAADLQEPVPDELRLF